MRAHGLCEKIGEPSTSDQTGRGGKGQVSKDETPQIASLRSKSEADGNQTFDPFTLPRRRVIIGSRTENSGTGETGRLPVGLGTASPRLYPIPGMRLRTQERTEDAIPPGAGFIGVDPALCAFSHAREPAPERQNEAIFRQPPPGCRPTPSRLFLTPVIPGHRDRHALFR